MREHECKRDVVADGERERLRERLALGHAEQLGVGVREWLAEQKCERMRDAEPLAEWLDYGHRMRLADATRG